MGVIHIYPKGNSESSIGKKKECDFYSKARATFRQRNGQMPLRSLLQIDNLLPRTRNLIWSEIRCSKLFVSLNVVCKWIRLELYGIDFDTSPTQIVEHRVDVLGTTVKSEREIANSLWLEEKIKTASIGEVFDIIEYITNQQRLREWWVKTYSLMYLNDPPCAITCDVFNDIFRSECVGFRFINGLITQIVEEVEAKAVVEAIETLKDAPSKHLEKALRLFSDRGNPDYANTVKEAITAVEAQCAILLNKDNITLGDALSKLEANGFKISGALKEGFKKIYGFTSNESGVRHGGLEVTSITQELAQFMLVTCSAFINYLRALNS
jgi:hypothetical protein